MTAFGSGGQKPGHKYIKRTGSPGNYSYWYKYPDGSIRQGEPDQQRSGRREHAHRLLAGRSGGQHKMTNEQISKETGAESSHVQSLETNMKHHARRGRAGHDFEDEHLTEASGDTMQSRKEKLQSELESRESKKVDTDETLKKLEDSVKNIKEKMKDEAASKNSIIGKDGKVDEFELFDQLKSKGIKPDDIEHEGHFEDAVYKEFPDEATKIMNNIKDRGLLSYMPRDFSSAYDSDEDEEESDIPKELAEKVKRLGKGEGRKVDLKAHELETLLESGTFALISAGRNPAIEDDTALEDKAIKERHKKLEGDLVEGGYAYSPVTGHYEGSEDSFLVMVHDADSKHMEELGEKYNQDSVIYSEGGKAQGIYTTGENKGKMVYGEGHEVTPTATDYFTEFSHPDGGTTKFSLNLWKDEESSRVRERSDIGKSLRMVISKAEPYFIFDEEPLVKSSNVLGISERITLIKGILDGRKKMSFLQK